MQGKIIRGVGGFYYVHVPSIGLLECKAKGAFRNRRVKPLVGDNVDVTILDEANALGNIEEILPRHSELIRPAVANVDQAIVIFAASYPKPNINLLDRFLLMMQWQDVPVSVCFNKLDTADDGFIEEYTNVYKDSGASLFFTSTYEGARRAASKFDWEDNSACRTVRCWKIFCNECTFSGSRYGNWGDQYQN